MLKSVNIQIMDKRRANFKKLGEMRTREVLRRIKILGNCANRSHYDYTEEEVNRIFSEIERKIRETKSKFTFPNKENDFKL